ncbi:MAG TPA: hypothetical protein ENJ55_00580 [Rhizobiales bacterium]|nr:hypothetical protein [Hyphomicrobiales bacterium]
MLEYVLFHQKPFDLFISFLKENGLKAITSENDGMYEIKISEDISPELSEKIEVEYDRLMALNHELFVAETPVSKDNYRMATVMITLKTGELTSAHISPDILGRVLEVIDEVELNEIITAVVDAVENPDDRTYCQKVRANEISFDDEP